MPDTKASLRDTAPDRQESGKAHRAAAEFWRKTALQEDGAANADRERARQEERQADRDTTRPRARSRQGM